MKRQRFLAVGFALALVVVVTPATISRDGVQAQAQTPTQRPRPVTTVQPPPAFVPVSDEGTGCFLGGVTKGKFVLSNEAAPLVKGGERYRMYSLAGYLGRGTGGIPASLGAPCAYQTAVEIAPDYSSYDAIGVAGTWPAMPRLPRAMSNSARVYRDATATLLKGYGIAQPNVKVTQVLRVDLEGDRVDEVLVSATHYASGTDGWPTPNVDAGDYSIVYLRKVVGRTVVTRVLAAEAYPRFEQFVAPMSYVISGVLDLNGDGTMEVVVYSRYYEGHGSTVYQVRGTQVEEVLGCGCGA